MILEFILRMDFGSRSRLRHEGFRLRFTSFRLRFSSFAGQDAGQDARQEDFFELVAKKAPELHNSGAKGGINARWDGDLKGIYPLHRTFRANL